MMKKKRVTSIDVFRGLTLMLMILVNETGNQQNTYGFLEHARWDGCTVVDLGFPFFIFVMGMAIPFSITEKGGITRNLMAKLGIRALRLINLGLAINYVGYFYIPMVGPAGIFVFHVIFVIVVGYLSLAKFKPKFKLVSALVLFLGLIALPIVNFPGFDQVRIPGILQRIGIVYFITGLLYVSMTFKKQLLLGVAILLVYWAILAWVPVPGLGHPSLTENANLASYIDRLLLGDHLWKFTNTWDPEGVLGTIPAIVSCLAGVWTGKYIKMEIRPIKLMLVGGVCIAIALLWSTVLPFNKALWTSSFTVYCIGWALLFTATFIYLFDHKEKDGLFVRFMLVWGLNPIILYYGSEVLSRLLQMLPAKNTNMWSYLYLDVLSPWLPDLKNASLVFATIHVLFWFIILRYLRRKDWLLSV